MPQSGFKVRAYSAIAIVLSIGLMACGSAPNDKPLTVSTSPNSPSSLGAILIAADSVWIGEYCLHAVGSKIAKEAPATAKQTLFEYRALRSIRAEVAREPGARYRGAPLRHQLLKLAGVLEGGGCDPAGAHMLSELSLRLPHE